jgi:hypothetical protein
MHIPVWLAQREVVDERDLHVRVAHPEHAYDVDEDVWNVLADVLE